MEYMGYCCVPHACSPPMVFFGKAATEELERHIMPGRPRKAREKHKLIGVMWGLGQELLL